MGADLLASRRRIVCDEGDNAVKRLSLIAGCVGALLVVGQAAAGPFFSSSRPRVARPGDVITLRAGLGVRVRDLMPLYLVPVRLAPHPFICHRGRGSCTPTARMAPSGAPYVRVATLDVRHAEGSPAAGYNVTIRFRIPTAMRPGRYAYVLYCRWCARKGSGSLIAWPTHAGAAGTKSIVAGTALVLR